MIAILSPLPFYLTTFFTLRQDWLLLGGVVTGRAFLLVHFTPLILHYSSQLEGEIPNRRLSQQHLQFCSALLSVVLASFFKLKSTGHLISSACRRYSARFLKLLPSPFSNWRWIFVETRVLPRWTSEWEVRCCARCSVTFKIVTQPALCRWSCVTVCTLLYGFSQNHRGDTLLAS